MLVRQGADSFELWTGCKAPVNINERYYSAGIEVNNETNIALIGFMGWGKSAIAKVLAARLGMTLIEIDL